ncbi:hypothetical protein HELRODRAFT_167259 [Helobdella robusta]|uniref:Uncharacterized protein n=1 Tax=Helobdella robusta TaxID=6412 RepID=T1EZ66_HELRO|nr:hypothetical protein HELRODRAFT_167259 [Helobdella robusta]ESO10762.1 hypothetical protein HELRODRAFT_167259 [Helobdella robusta]
MMMIIWFQGRNDDDDDDDEALEKVPPRAGADWDEARATFLSIIPAANSCNKPSQPSDCIRLLPMEQPLRPSCFLSLYQEPELNLTRMAPTHSNNRRNSTNTTASSPVATNHELMMAPTTLVPLEGSSGQCASFILLPQLPYTT